jgi:colanic acid biosynthesis glycosyl transferase WcaI
MPKTVLIDYGCHSFSYLLAARLFDDGRSFQYIANGSLESPNLQSLPAWAQERPGLIKIVSCSKPYGKLSLKQRLFGELEWARRCLQTLEEERPSAIICSCTPLPVALKLQEWARRKGVPFVYWLQDLQGRAISQLLSQRFGIAGSAAGSLGNIVEQRMLSRCDYVITIADGHQDCLPASVRRNSRFGLLRNWANIEQIPQAPVQNAWSLRHGLADTTNIIYSGTLGMKHDLWVFPALAWEFRNRPDVRIVVVSSGQAADHIREEAKGEGLDNLVVLPFQPYSEVPLVLASASVLIAPLDPSAGSFCVPSKILSYLCAGRPTVLAIDQENPAARMIGEAEGGLVVKPGDTKAFVSAVCHLVENQDIRVRLGERARAYAESTFQIDHVVSRFLSIMDQAGVALPSASCLTQTLSPVPHSAS